MDRARRDALAVGRRTKSDFLKTRLPNESKGQVEPAAGETAAGSICTALPALDSFPKRRSGLFRKASDMPDGPKRAVVLVSGGLDSATTLAVARRDGFEPCALSFDYGQRHSFELEAARRVAQAANVHRHLVFKLDLRSIGGSSLTADLPVPKDRPESEMISRNSDRLTFRREIRFFCRWPSVGVRQSRRSTSISASMRSTTAAIPIVARNTLLPSSVWQLSATKAGVEGAGSWKIHTPLIRMTKAEIIKTGIELGVDYSLTHSCYDPGPQGRPCGRCDSCILRLKGFAEAGLHDPLTY